VAVQAADLTDIAPTVLLVMGLPAEGMEGRPLGAALDAAADAAPLHEQIAMPRGFLLEAMRDPLTRRLYPTAMRRAG
jgi:hypothetical protein